MLKKYKILFLLKGIFSSSEECARCGVASDFSVMPTNHMARDGDEKLCPYCYNQVSAAQSESRVSQTLSWQYRLRCVRTQLECLKWAKIVLDDVLFNTLNSNMRFKMEGFFSQMCAEKQHERFYLTFCLNCSQSQLKESNLEQKNLLGRCLYCMATEDFFIIPINKLNYLLYSNFLCPHCFHITQPRFCSSNDEEVAYQSLLDRLETVQDHINTLVNFVKRCYINEFIENGLYQILQEKEYEESLLKRAQEEYIDSENYDKSF